MNQERRSELRKLCLAGKVVASMETVSLSIKNMDEIVELLDALDAAEAQIEKLKCCGNCKHELDEGDFCLGKSCKHFHFWEPKI